MRKIVSIILIITLLVSITGCNYQTKSIPEELRKVELNEKFSVISEDEKKYIGKIQFQNNTSYDFIPTGVHAQLEIRYLDNGTDTAKPNPIKFQTKQISYDSNKYEYEVEIPKKAFDVYERTGKDYVVITIEGFFTKNGRIVLQLSRGLEGRLIKD